MAGRSLGGGSFELDADISALRRKLAEATASIKASGDTAERAFGQKATGGAGRFASAVDAIRVRMDKLGGPGSGASFFGNTTSKALEKVTSKARDAGEAIGTFISDSIEAASQLQQSTGAVAAVFGKAASKIEAFGKTAAESAGLSRDAVNDMAAVVGAKLTGMGYSTDLAADKVVGLEKRAADMAATFGGKTADALDAISSLLTGERDPIERYGVSLKDADIKARILADGLDTSTTAAEKNATAVASLELLMDATAKTTGRFAAEADSLAGKLEIAAAKLVNKQAELGQKFQPIAEQVTSWQINFLDGLSLLSDGISGKVTPAILAMAAADGKLAVITEGARGKIHEMDIDTLNAAVHFGVLTQAEEDAELAARGVGTAAKGLGDSLADVADRGDRAASLLVVSATRTGKAYRGLRRDLLADAQGTVTGYFDVLITQDKLTATNAQISAAKRVLASATATRAEKHDAKVALHQLGADQAQYMQDLAKGGASGSKVFTTTMKGLLHDLSTSHGAERRAILAEIRALELLAAKAYAARQATLPYGGGGNVSTYG
nr:hypothetical protein [Chloroflexota bacterium]